MLGVLQAIVTVVYAIVDTVCLVAQCVFYFVKSPAGCGLMVVATAAVSGAAILHFEYGVTWLAVVLAVGALLAYI